MVRLRGWMGMGGETEGMDGETKGMDGDEWGD